jgi:diguanylate cyclase (GGDEF)-like protein
LQREIQQVITSKKQFRGEMDYPAANGHTAFYDYILVPAFNQAGEVEAVAGTARNITERKAIEDLNWQRANYDVLTGLPNRRLLGDRLEQDIKHAGRINAQIALLFIDLDHFKAANDNFGHDAGDILLRLAADRIRVCVRETDTVARLGGDEFTVILQGLGGIEHVELVAGKIVEAIARPFEISGHSVNISSSIGIAIFPDDASTPDQLLKNADEAMYLAKAQGRNKFYFFSPH